MVMWATASPTSPSSPFTNLRTYGPFGVSDSIKEPKSFDIPVMNNGSIVGFFAHRNNVYVTAIGVYVKPFWWLSCAWQNRSWTCWLIWAFSFCVYAWKNKLGSDVIPLSQPVCWLVSTSVPAASSVGRFLCLNKHFKHCLRLNNKLVVVFEWHVDHAIS